MKTHTLLSGLGLCISAVAADLSVSNLRCEYQTNPLTVDTARPRLSWVLSSPTRGAKQTAYQILVARSPQSLAADQGDLWNSGKVASDQTSHIEVPDTSLNSGTECFWKVRAWDHDGQPSAWSAPGFWMMGLRKPEDWQASWIRADLTDDISPWFRKTFVLETAPPRAVAYVNVIGYGELYVNGRKVGSDVLSPAVSDTRVHSWYVAYDIGPFLKAGRNCIGLWCGRGWSNKAKPGGQRVRFQCLLKTDANRDPLRVVSDESWKVAPSPYTTLGRQSWGKFGGERYDANLEQPGWCTAEFDDAKWLAAKPAPAEPPRAEAQSCPPNRVGKVIPAITCTPLAEGRFEFDFGTNLTGHIHLRMRGLKPNQRIRISYADRKYAAGEMTASGPSDIVLPGSSGNLRYQSFGQADEFFAANRETDEFRSKFNYHGFRHAIVEGLTTAPVPQDAEALLVESDLEPAGSFECSNDLLNRIHALNLWTIRCLNLGGYMVDCPHRERLGYGDGQVSVDSQAYNLWSPAFYEKWTNDWRIAQRPDTGDIPHTAPDWGGGGGPAWGGSLATLTWRMYELYGDRRILRDNYEPMRRYVDFIESHCKDNVLRGYGGQWDFLGDWVPPGRGMDTKNWPARDAAELFNNCFRVYLWEILARSADVLGKTDEATRCQTALAAMRPAIHQAFFDETKGIYVIDEQAYQVMPLLSGIVPPDRREAVFAKLKDGILNRCKGHLDTGMLGTHFLLQYLQQTGHDDLVFTILNQKTYPGWGFMLESGATTLWEQWNGYFSHIHSCFASPGGWFYQSLAGIRTDPAIPGFKKIVIKPSIVGDVTWVKAHHDSIHGRITSNWRRDGNNLTMDVSIPANTTATIHVPAKDAEAVSESGKPAVQAAGVKLLRKESGSAVWEAGSGDYRFQSSL